MLPTFVIGLREGLEAALIVGIIAAFLRRQGRADLLRQMALGVATAVAICVAGGIALEAYSRNLPQRQQEGLETVIGVLAVAMVTYMVIWMKEHSRGLKAELESLTAEAISGRGRAGTAMVAMAFLAVLREGFETVVFLLAAFNETGQGGSALAGAVLGLAVAIALGYGIYRGGVRINLSRFFRATGLVLVLVAAGLVVTALHTAHEAGWLDAGQHRALDLSWLVQPGSVLSSLLTGMLGIQPYPVAIEVVGWVLYAVPLGVFVAWPPGRPVPLRTLGAGLVGLGVLGLAAAAVLVATAPSAPAPARDRVVARDGRETVTVPDRFPLSERSTGSRTLVLSDGRATTTTGAATMTYRAAVPGPSASTTLSADRAAALNGGRLPLGVLADRGRLRATVTDARVATVTVEPRTGRVLRVDWTQTRRAQVSGRTGEPTALATPLASATSGTSRADLLRAVAAARSDLDALEARGSRVSVAWLAGVVGAAALAGGALLGRRRRPDVTEPARAVVHV